MKYTTTITIDLPKARVFELLVDPAHYEGWMSGLLSKEAIEGDPGSVGAKTRLVHKMGSREVEMMETIVEATPSDSMTATYESGSVWNQVVNRLSEVDGSTTRWEMESEFRCKGPMWLMSKLMPGMFKKESQKGMESFKSFAEALGDS